MKNNNKQDKVVEILTAKSEELIEQHPHLKKLQSEVDRLLSNAPDEQTRQEILDIMFQTGRNDLHAQIDHLNGLLDALNTK
ncbi:hypothetical protein DSCW_53250 [Desulfosarcina widdelii]|uniref:Uncharacterized protein n=1 Tax=Desulfosarcina widdelii TaxID=947919 RepID=A0A5K7ZA40_9BACT|nr:hypothetical protein [Desulfosarcina widdelii]BBO77908.1 hypothetical protein DSCW_53250 [Desulfosarcina widdelii]